MFGTLFKVLMGIGVGFWLVEWRRPGTLNEIWESTAGPQMLEDAQETGEHTANKARRNAGV